MEQYSTVIIIPQKLAKLQCGTTLDLEFWPLEFWKQRYKESESCYTPAEKEILAIYEAIQAASKVIGTEAQLLLAPCLPVLGWMFKGQSPTTHHAINAICSKWITLITQQASTGNTIHPGISEVTTKWPEGESALDYHWMRKKSWWYVLRSPHHIISYWRVRGNMVPFLDRLCWIGGTGRKWEAAVESSTWWVMEAVKEHMLQVSVTILGVAGTTLGMVGIMVG